MLRSTHGEAARVLQRPGGAHLRAGGGDRAAVARPHPGLLRRAPHARRLARVPGTFTHILGHAGWDHLLANFSIILIIGPILEERHGSASLLAMIAVTALITGLVNAAFFNQYLVAPAASRLAMVILGSVANIKGRRDPADLHRGGRAVRGPRGRRRVQGRSGPQGAHLIGGTVGGAFGFSALAQALRGGTCAATPAPAPRPVGASGRQAAGVTPRS
ncbi:MAG: rhomboid family intramembrane serine protease [Myxococcales bacterium]|nr:rhomboid family intramembrane serine protease [Myxococcales bacterium]